jgi:hypothetical protein
VPGVVAGEEPGRVGGRRAGEAIVGPFCCDREAHAGEALRDVMSRHVEVAVAGIDRP